jgi:hypothetical protein
LPAAAGARLSAAWAQPEPWFGRRAVEQNRFQHPPHTRQGDKRDKLARSRAEIITRKKSLCIWTIDLQLRETATESGMNPVSELQKIE